MDPEFPEKEEFKEAEKLYEQTKKALDDYKSSKILTW